MGMASMVSLGGAVVIIVIEVQVIHAGLYR